tara:strand:- start:1975 stop:3918 length:1944 start_codon:yes stop_codon:yes gene_type:complete
MATELDKLIVKIQADISGLKQGLDKANSQVSKSSKKMRTNMQKFGTTLDRVGKRALAFGSLFAVAFGGIQIKRVIDAGRTVEDLGVRLKALFGTAEEGSKAFKVMLDFAGKVPFSLGEIQKGAGSLAVVSKDANELAEILEITGNVAGATGLDFRQTAEQIQRSFSSGIASADVFRERGVGAMLGFQKGAEVSVAETVRVFKEQFGSGGRFGNVTKDLAKTLTGTLSMLSDKLLQFRLAVSETFMVEIKKQLTGMNNALQDSTKNVEKIGNEIGKKLAGAVSLFAENIDVVIRGLTALGVFLTGAMGLVIFNFVAGLGAIGTAVLGIGTAYTLLGNVFAKTDKFIDPYANNTKRATDNTHELEDALKDITKMNNSTKWFATLRDALGENVFKLKEVNENIKLVIVSEEQMKEITQDLEKVFNDAGKSISKAFGKAVVSGGSFRDSMRSILISVSEQIIATISQILIIDPLIRGLTNSLKEYNREISMSVSGKKGGGFFDTILNVGLNSLVGAFTGGLAPTPSVAPAVPNVPISKMYGDRGFSLSSLRELQGLNTRASGGFVSPSMPYLVGEKGAELFMPKSAGTIIPNDKMGGGAVTINQNLNFSTGIVPTVRAEVQNLMPQIKKETVGAVAEARSRGGAFARTFGA